MFGPNLVFRQKVLMALPPLELFSLRRGHPVAGWPLHFLLGVSDCETERDGLTEVMWVASDFGKSCNFYQCVGYRGSSGVADRRCVERECSAGGEGLPMCDALVALCFVMIVLGPCVVASMVDLNRSVPD